LAIVLSDAGARGAAADRAALLKLFATLADAGERLS
jgi:hypothetical protein